VAPLKVSLFKFVRAFRTLVLFVKATGAATKKEHERALEITLAIFRLFGCSQPCTDAPPILNVFYADMCQRVRRNLDAYEACKVSIKQIDDRLANCKKAVHRNNLIWLKFRCKWILITITQYSDSDAFNLARSMAVTSDMLDRSNSSRTLRSTFPCDPDDAAKVDAFVFANGVGGSTPTIH
jgi:hypothetical protein